MPRLSWLVKLYGNLTYVRMRPAAIALNYSIKDIRHDVRQIIYIIIIIIIIYHEKSRLNRLVLSSLMLDRPNNMAANSNLIQKKVLVWFSPVS